MFGDSYLAATQVAVAPLGSPLLRALNARFMASDCFERASYCDGAFSLALTWSRLCFECASRISHASGKPLFGVPALLRTLPLISLASRHLLNRVPAGLVSSLVHGEDVAQWEVGQ